jgi:hypothetical protein
VAHFRHGELCDVETLIDFLQQHADQVKRLIRPPFGRFEQLAGRRGANSDFRDPRVERDQQHDMRMPPYMRDCDALPLSLTVRQYDALMKLVKIPAAKGVGSPVTRRVGRFMQRRREAPDE